MFILKLVFVACAVLIKCETAFVDTLSKCSIKDDECIGELFESSLRKIGSVGIPELNMPPIDPYKVTNMTIKVLEAIKLTMTDGVVKGISKCQIKKYHVDLDKQTGVQEILCDLIIKGNIVVEGTSPLLQGVFGTPSIDSAGKGKVKLDKLFLRFDFPLIPFKKDDGEIYFKILSKKIKYKYDVEKATFGAEKIMVGKEDMSKAIVPYFNNNYKAILEIIGDSIFDAAKEIFADILKKFFEFIPSKNYIADDLSYLVK
ncbi:uncharacterized protein LOC112043064 [Bicyclus anynana]|uniref:Uncharacterized protein LOC112043064 n=1 Tax=Bicyclus anynana TaxID=110368 RepID=A0A6J1MUE5_BICAN|nr:uncharacterized protein LOC112043064 [Bicyclus anynana]